MFSENISLEKQSLIPVLKCKKFELILIFLKYEFHSYKLYYPHKKILSPFIGINHFKLC